MAQRIQRKRTKGWRKPEGAVIVDRTTIYGNPFKAGVDFCGPTIRRLHGPAELVAAFEDWINRDTLHPLMWEPHFIGAHGSLKAALARGDLTGKDLACWCPLDQPCHADVLLRLANPEGA